MSSIRKSVPLLIGFCVVAIYLLQLRQAASAVPYWDDYDVVFAFIQNWDAADSWQNRLSLLWQQHNEHRLFSLRILILFFVYFFSTIGIKLQLAAASLSLLLIVFVLNRLTGSRWNSFFAATLIAICFAPSFEDSALWYTGAISNFFVLSLGFLAFYLAAQPGRVWLAGAAAAILAAGFQGNGVFVAPLCFLLSLITYPKNFIRLGVWAITALVICVGYFTNYHSVGGHCEITFAIFSLGNYALYSLAFMGSALAFGEFNVAVTAGVIISSIFFAALYKGVFRREPVFAALILFLLLTVASNCIGRACFGLDYAVTQPRYRIFGVVFVASALALLESVGRYFSRPKFGLPLMLLSFAGFLSVSYAMHPYLLWQRSKLEQGFMRALTSPKREGVYFPVTEQAWGYFEYVKAKGLTKLDENIRQTFQAPEIWMDVIAHKERIIYGLAIERPQNGEVLIHGWLVPPQYCASGYSVSAIVKSGETRHEYQLKRLHRQDANELFKRSAHDVLGFMGILPEPKEADAKLFLALRNCGAEYQAANGSGSGAVVAKKGSKFQQ